MRKLMFALAILAMTMTTASAQSSGPANAFFGGGLGAYPTGGSYQPSPPQTARHAPKVAPQAKSYASACEATCRSKCQASWQVGGYRNVEACYAAWAKINAMGMGERCEAASRARGGRPGPC